MSHVTRTPLQGQKVKDQLARGEGILWRPPAQLVLSILPVVAMCIMLVVKRMQCYATTNEPTYL